MRMLSDFLFTALKGLCRNTYSFRIGHISFKIVLTQALPVLIISKVKAEVIRFSPYRLALVGLNTMKHQPLRHVIVADAFAPAIFL